MLLEYFVLHRKSKNTWPNSFDALHGVFSVWKDIGETWENHTDPSDLWSKAKMKLPPRKSTPGMSHGSSATGIIVTSLKRASRMTYKGSNVQSKT